MGLVFPPKVKYFLAFPRPSLFQTADSDLPTSLRGLSVKNNSSQRPSDIFRWTDCCYMPHTFVARRRQRGPGTPTMDVDSAGFVIIETAQILPCESIVSVKCSNRKAPHRFPLHRTLQMKDHLQLQRNRIFIAFFNEKTFSIFSSLLIPSFTWTKNLFRQ